MALSTSSKVSLVQIAFDGGGLPNQITVYIVDSEGGSAGGVTVSFSPYPATGSTELSNLEIL